EGIAVHAGFDVYAHRTIRHPQQSHAATVRHIEVACIAADLVEHKLAFRQLYQRYIDGPAAQPACEQSPQDGSCHNTRFTMGCATHCIKRISLMQPDIGLASRQHSVGDISAHACQLNHCCVASAVLPGTAPSREG